MWQGGAAAAANEETVARVDALAHGDLFDGRDHVVIAGGRDRVCGLFTAHAEMLRDPIDRVFRQAAIELDAAAKKEVGVENSEHDIGVGYGRVGAPLSIAGRPGPGARAVRADVQKSALNRHARLSRRRRRSSARRPWESPGSRC